MPELPEVETIARGLAKRVNGDVIDSVWIGEKRDLLKSPAHEIAAALEHSRIVSVHRMGKHIVFDLKKSDLERPGLKKDLKKKAAAHADKSAKKSKSKSPAETDNAASSSPVHSSQNQWIVHLGMTGRLQVCEPDAEISKHTHAVVKLASGRELRFVDPRRFGRLGVAVDFDAGGIEPLEATFDQFFALFRGRKTPIKSALLNQKLLRGVGNIYADEALSRAGIRPRRRTSSITRDQFAKLFTSLQEVLREAISLGGSTVSDYVNADGDKGFFQLQHRVYGREGEPCVVCKTPVKRVVIGGRSSHYCPKCQK